jgi:hypothetical protein
MPQLLEQLRFLQAAGRFLAAALPEPKVGQVAVAELVHGPLELEQYGSQLAVVGITQEHYLRWVRCFRWWQAVLQRISAPWAVAGLAG